MFERTTEQQIERMRLEILGDSNNTDKDEIFEAKLESAKYVALDRMYPFHHEDMNLPERYQDWQVRAAIELYKRMGDEGIVSYSENGLSYTYAGDLLSSNIMQELPPPKAGVIS